MPETESRFTQFCRDLEIEPLERVQDLEQALDHTLTECERRLDEGASSLDEPALRKLVGLVRLARDSRMLLVPESADDAGHAEPAPDPVDRRLREAQEEARRLQRRLDETMQELRGGKSRREVDPEQLGELFGSISRLCHKINNPLTSIMGRAQILQLKIKPGGGGDQQLTKSVGVIEESARRVAELIQELANLVCQGRKEFAESYDSSKGSR